MHFLFCKGWIWLCNEMNLFVRMFCRMLFQILLGKCVVNGLLHCIFPSFFLGSQVMVFYQVLLLNLKKSLFEILADPSNPEYFLLVFTLLCRLHFHHRRKSTRTWHLAAAHESCAPGTVFCQLANRSGSCTVFQWFRVPLHMVPSVFCSFMGSPPISSFRLMKYWSWSGLKSCSGGKVICLSVSYLWFYLFFSIREWKYTDRILHMHSFKQGVSEFFGFFAFFCDKITIFLWGGGWNPHADASACDMMREASVKIFCGKCDDIYYPRSSRHKSVLVDFECPCRRRSRCRCGCQSRARSPFGVKTVTSFDVVDG